MLPSIFSENLFDDFFNSAMFPKAEHELYGKHAKNLMNTDVREVENGYEIDMNLPGFKKDEVEIQLQDGCLTVSAAKGLDKDERIRRAVISARSVTPVPSAAASMWARMWSLRM